MGPYIVDGHFMYGNTFCIPPYNHRPPYYNTICHHRAPAFRGLPQRLIADLGARLPYSEPPSYDEDGDCTNVVRSDSIPNITSITAKTIKTLRIKLWGLTEEEDATFELEIGKRYAITYLVEGGFAVADGYLEYIDDSISDECTKYIGSYDANILQAYIGLDCSTTGNADKRKIYISSIRKIEELEDDEDYVADDTATMTDSSKLDYILNLLQNKLTISDNELSGDSAENLYYKLNVLAKYLMTTKDDMASGTEDDYNLISMADDDDPTTVESETEEYDNDSDIEILMLGSSLDSSGLDTEGLDGSVIIPGSSSQSTAGDDSSNWVEDDVILTNCCCQNDTLVDQCEILMRVMRKVHQYNLGTNINTEVTDEDVEAELDGLSVNEKVDVVIDRLNTLDPYLTFVRKDFAKGSGLRASEKLSIETNIALSIRYMDNIYNDLYTEEI